MQRPNLSLTCQLLLASGVIALPMSDALAGPKNVPFKATLSISEQVIPNNPPFPCYLTGNVMGTGHATHLGKVSTTSTDCINPISATAFSFTSREVTLIAANGDQLQAAYSGTLTLEDGVYAIAGGYQILGGTGRFANATGAGTLQGLEDISATPAQGQLQLTGTISY